MEILYCSHLIALRHSSNGSNFAVELSIPIILANILSMEILYCSHFLIALRHSSNRSNFAVALLIPNRLDLPCSRFGSLHGINKVRPVLHSTTQLLENPPMSSNESQSTGPTIGVKRQGALELGPKKKP